MAKFPPGVPLRLAPLPRPVSNTTVAPTALGLSCALPTVDHVVQVENTHDTTKLLSRVRTESFNEWALTVFF